MKLGDIAEMRTGIVVSSFNSNIVEDNQEKYKVLNLSSIDEYNRIDVQKMEELQVDYEKIKDCLTKKGDILIRQSHPFTVLVIDEEVDLIVPSTFLIIRIENNNYDKGFIGWYLSTNKIKNNFIKHQIGSTQPTINKKIVSAIDLPRVDIKKQLQISSLATLLIRRSKKINKLLEEVEKENELITKLLVEKI